MNKTKKDEKGYKVFIDSGKPVHKWVAEQKYGKEKVAGMYVHHVDGDKLNNNKNNLILLSKEDHYTIETHERIRKNLSWIMIYLCVIYTINIILSDFLPSFGKGYSVAIARGSVFLMLVISFELATNGISKMLKSPVVSRNKEDETDN